MVMMERTENRKFVSRKDGQFSKQLMEGVSDSNSDEDRDSHRKVCNMLSAL